MQLRPTICRIASIAGIALAVIFASGESVGATTPNTIEGVWSFNGGAVAVQVLSDGTFQGTVVTPTTFASCQHPAGQVMWTDMRQQEDGSFWGLHQWYHAPPKCEANTVLGLTAWRVLTSSSGARVLKVCFNPPGDTVQPTIAPDGTPANVTYGCAESSPLGALPTVSGESSNPGAGSGGGSGASEMPITFNKTVILPPAKACVSQTSLRLELKDPKYDPLAEVVVRINGRKVADIKGVKRLKKGVTLKKLPSGTYKLSVLATTVLKQHLSGSQTYQGCGKGSGKVKLHRVKARRV